MLQVETRRLLDRGKGFVDLISIQESLAGQRLTDDGVFDTGRGRVSAGGGGRMVAPASVSRAPLVAHLDHFEGSFERPVAGQTGKG